jgi:hypothetical protein
LLAAERSTSAAQTAAQAAPQAAAAAAVVAAATSSVRKESESSSSDDLESVPGSPHPLLRIGSEERAPDTTWSSTTSNGVVLATAKLLAPSVLAADLNDAVGIHVDSKTDSLQSGMSNSKGEEFQSHTHQDGMGTNDCANDGHQLVRVGEDDYDDDDDDNIAGLGNGAAKQVSIQPSPVAMVHGIDNATLRTVVGREAARLRLLEDEELLQDSAKRAAAKSAGVSSEMLTDVQELLRLFGVPFVTAPMEAEAQCAALERAGQTQGTITDDSDIFLFGGTTVYRRVCSRTKGTEVYNAATVHSVLGLDRSRLIRLAYLLGCDYTVGVAGIGVVTAMKILAQFPNDTMLDDFKEWMSEDPETEASTPRGKLSKLLKSSKNPVVLAQGFPDKRVEESFRRPVVDSGMSRFHWGDPDIDGIRQFCERKLGWSEEQTNAQVLPVMNRLRERKSTQPSIASFMEPARTVFGRAPAMRSSVKASVDAVKKRDRRGAKQDSSEDESASSADESETKTPKAPFGAQKQPSGRRKGGGRPQRPRRPRTTMAELPDLLDNGGPGVKRRLDDTKPEKRKRRK